MKKYAALTAMTLAIVGVAVADQSEAERFEKVARRLVGNINAARHQAIDGQFSPSMRDFMPLEKNKRFFGTISRRFGRIEELDEAWVKSAIQASFVADCERGKLDLDLWLNDRDEIIGLRMTAHKPGPPVHERNRTPLRLPFDGRWIVSWGGDTKALNRHHDVRNQRFAFDFLGVDDAGRTRRGRTDRNEDYYAFGRDIVAPADGVVTDVIRGVRDNKPGSMNPYSALGNAVFVSHSRHEVSVLAHFKQGSIVVEVGDRVKAGQLLGECGNSGNSSEPHLHYHLQNTPIIQDGTGIKCYFKNVELEGNKGERAEYSPVKDDIVKPSREP